MLFSTKNGAISYFLGLGFGVSHPYFLLRRLCRQRLKRLLTKSSPRRPKIPKTISCIQSSIVCMRIFKSFILDEDGSRTLRRKDAHSCKERWLCGRLINAHLLASLASAYCVLMTSNRCLGNKPIKVEWEAIAHPDSDQRIFAAFALLLRINPHTRFDRTRRVRQDEATEPPANHPHHANSQQ